MFRPDGLSLQSACRYNTNGATPKVVKMMLRNALVLLLAALVLGCQASVDNNVLRGKSNAAVEPSEQRRHLISFWSILFELLQHPPCPPGPLGHHCHNDETDTDNENDSSSTAAATAGASDADADEYYAGESEGTSSSQGGTSVSKSTIWLMAVAAAAAVAAIIAAAVGQRRDKEDMHPLKGAVSRRMNLFTSLCDGNLCVDRPPRVF